MSSPPISLCPGYTHVAAFGSDDEFEDGEDVSYVALDLGDIEPTLVPNSSTYRLIGLDTPTPFLQLSGTVLKGRHNPLLGTNIVFTDDPESHDWSKRSVVHVANTEERIEFRQVRLQPKIAATHTAAGQEQQPEGSRDSVPRQQVKAGLLDGEDPAQQIDRVTGKISPPLRVRGVGTRKKRGKKKSEQERLDGEGGARQRAVPSAKGKERAHDDDDEDDVG